MEQYRVVGIVSAGIGCALPKLPGIYTRVESYLDWIELNINHYYEKEKTSNSKNISSSSSSSFSSPKSSTNSYHPHYPQSNDNNHIYNYYETKFYNNHHHHSYNDHDMDYDQSILYPDNVSEIEPNLDEDPELGWSR
ncbi:hypothetical protein BLA29_008237 [Euroglyphus maynei]|uniref:Peptidase S1 domain-containing protein n=1 Tax=Euroglyphus maynei TaxID=6958 RepID=A0A1Y3BBG2_EURMA|nr:hypothetical protein BLA29_008237 [Euroglyphus maynei]